jgi:glycogen synthase
MDATLTFFKEQEEFGMVLRAAADVVFVPSHSEAFGLVAAEGLAMGAVVLSTGVGGLSDFLVLTKTNETQLFSKELCQIRARERGKQNTLLAQTTYFQYDTD